MPAKAPFIAQHNTAQVVVVAHATQHDVGALARLPRGVLAAFPPNSLTQAWALLSCAVVDGNVMSARLRWPAIGNPITPRPEKRRLAAGAGCTIWC